MNYILKKDELMHYGILGMHWGIRRFQNEDGSLTPEGRKRYYKGNKYSGDYEHLTIRGNYANRQVRKEINEVARDIEDKAMHDSKFREKFRNYRDVQKEANSYANSLWGNKDQDDAFDTYEEWDRFKSDVYDKTQEKYGEQLRKAYKQAMNIIKRDMKGNDAYNQTGYMLKEVLNKNDPSMMEKINYGEKAFEAIGNDLQNYNIRVVGDETPFNKYKDYE